MFRKIRFILLGFGSVGQALATLIDEKRAELHDRYALDPVCVAIATQNHGVAIDPDGLDMNHAINAYQDGNLDVLGKQPQSDTVQDLCSRIPDIPADVLVECTVLNPMTGRPALEYIQTAMAAGLDVVTANKGPIAWAYPELNALAHKTGRRLRFESTVLDGIPLFRLKETCLPGLNILSITGVLTSTTNLVLTEMEKGASLEQAIRTAQNLGITEADPRLDIDGWDSAVKITILTNHWMGAKIVPSHVDHTGIGSLSPAQVRQARMNNKRYRLIGKARFGSDQSIQVSVRPVLLPLSHWAARLEGTMTGLAFESDVLSRIAILETTASGPRQTAYGILADLIHLACDSPNRNLVT